MKTVRGYVNAISRLDLDVRDLKNWEKLPESKKEALVACRAAIAEVVDAFERR